MAKTMKEIREEMISKIGAFKEEISITTENGEVDVSKISPLLDFPENKSVKKYFEEIVNNKVAVFPYYEGEKIKYMNYCSCCGTVDNDDSASSYTSHVCPTCGANWKACIKEYSDIGYRYSYNFINELILSLNRKDGYDIQANSDSCHFVALKDGNKIYFVELNIHFQRKYYESDVSANDYVGFPPKEYFENLLKGISCVCEIIALYCLDVAEHTFYKLTETSVSKSAGRIDYWRMNRMEFDGYEDVITKACTDMGVSPACTSLMHSSLTSTLSFYQKNLTKKAAPTTPRKETSLEKLIARASAIPSLDFKTNKTDNKVEEMISISLSKSFFKTKQVGRLKQFMFYCPVCQEYHIEECVTEDNQPLTLVCPECGTQVKFKETQYEKRFSEEAYDHFEFVYWNKIDEYPLISIYSVNSKLTFKLDDDDNHKVSWKKTTTVSENKRVLLYKNKMVIIDTRASSSSKNYTLKSKPDVVGLPQTSFCYNTDEEVKDIISSTILAYKGIEDSFGLTDLPNIRSLKINELSDGITKYMITVLYYEPAIERILKSGLVTLCKNLIYGYQMRDVDYSKSSAAEILGINRKYFKIIREFDLDASSIDDMRQMLKYDANLDYEDFSAISQQNRLIDAINILVQCQFDDGTCITNLHNIRKYMTSLYYDQCIPYSQGLGYWLDYIKMMKTLSFTKKVMKKELYPRSLKKSHDILVFAFNRTAKTVNAEKFALSIAASKKYEYHKGDYIVIAPKAASDMIQEGVDLNHSVAAHIESVADRKESILFIRKKNKPDESYYTVEVTNDGTVIQVAGQSNKPVNSPELKDFIESWAKAKKLTLNY